MNENIPKQTASIPLEPVLPVPEKAAFLSNTTTTPIENRPSTSNSLAKNGFESDLESQFPPPSRITTSTADGSTIFYRKNDQQVWPCQDQWKQRAQAAKRHNARRCAWVPWQNLSKRGKIMAKIVIILLIVGIAVGIGFGLSKSLGAPIWGKHS